ncbi:MAG: helix-turn-helix transcriptional regulator [Polyangiaceae bacterium]|nr:helix-turn-helix transcriptional regulator [Polyangiaceae bacterium]
MRAPMLLTTREVAALLKVHPKHVYRLMKRGLPAHRVGDEWRFDDAEIRAYVRGGAAERADVAGAARPVDDAPPLVAANGDLGLELLLSEVASRADARLGLVPTDHAGATALLGQRAVLVAGCHGDGRPAELAGVAVARLHLVEREVGLVFPRGARVRTVSAVAGRRLAVRPRTAGVRAHLDAALARAGIEPERALARARVFASHRDVALAVCRGEAEVGLATRAWGSRAGLGFLPLAAESYGLVARAVDVSSAAFIALAEAAQRGALRRALGDGLGYSTRRTGELRVHGAEP